VPPGAPPTLEAVLLLSTPLLAWVLGAIEASSISIARLLLFDAILTHRQWV
jgi:hypothetical protein